MYCRTEYFFYNLRSCVYRKIGIEDIALIVKTLDMAISQGNIYKTEDFVEPVAVCFCTVVELG